MSRVKLSDRIGTEMNGFYIEDVKRENGRSYAFVACPLCKNKKWMRIDTLQRKNTISCGCYNAEHNYKKASDISGCVFVRLKAIRPTERRDKHNGGVIWECECACGNAAFVSVGDLHNGAVTSCGCRGKENSAKNGKIAGKNIKDNFCIEGTNTNNLTMKTPSRNTSGIKGVSWDKSRQKWQAYIKFKGKNYFLGRYDKKEDAAKIRKVAEDKVFGEFLEWYNTQKIHKNI